MKSHSQKLCRQLSALAAKWERISKIQFRRVNEVSDAYKDAHYNLAIGYEECAKSLRKVLEDNKTQ